MKKKFGILNFILMLSVLFAGSYQSLHTFSHHKQEETKSVSSEKTFTKNISEKEHCPVCDFKFANFLSPEIFTYSFFPSHYEIPYTFSVKENLSIFCGSLFSPRGPPTLV
jgi:hypothetical protein